jgi:hypothetical protein
VTNALAYYEKTNYGHQKFYSTGPCNQYNIFRVNVLHLDLDVIHLLEIGFHPSLIFAGKVGAYSSVYREKFFTIIKWSNLQSILCRNKLECFRCQSPVRRHSVIFVARLRAYH